MIDYWEMLHKAVNSGVVMVRNISKLMKLSNLDCRNRWSLRVIKPLETWYVFFSLLFLALAL